MDIQLIRYKQGTESTLSKIVIAGLIRGFVLEDTDRNLTQTMGREEIAKQKVWGKTCIPTGRYELAMTYSIRFKRVMPQLMDVPGFEGIRMHVGNYVGDTDGCILPGTSFDQDKNGYYRVWDSRKALASLMIDIDAAVARKEQIWVTISRAYGSVAA